MILAAMLGGGRAAKKSRERLLFFASHTRYAKILRNRNKYAEPGARTKYGLASDSRLHYDLMPENSNENSTENMNDNKASWQMTRMNFGVYQRKLHPSPLRHNPLDPKIVAKVTANHG